MKGKSHPPLCDGPQESPPGTVDLGHFSLLFLVTGLSGAGKSTASRTLNDLGCFSIDHLPCALFPQFLQLSRADPERYRKTAILFAVDSSANMLELHRIIQQFGAPRPSNIRLLFLDADTPAIIRRYSETRRPHPGFNPFVDKTLEDAVQRERGLLLPFKEFADCVIDSSQLTVHDLRREVRAFAEGLVSLTPSRLRLNFVSFGHKYGIPLDCDLLADVRFIPNPFFIEGLREHTGLSPEVQQFVMTHPEVHGFIDKYAALLSELIPHYVHEGKTVLNIGIGCTGGKHRSVVVADALAKLMNAEHALVQVRHRDLGRE